MLCCDDAVGWDQVRRLREENDSLVASLQSQHSQGQEYTQELSSLRDTVKVRAPHSRVTRVTHAAMSTHSIITPRCPWGCSPGVGERAWGDGGR